MQLLQDALDYIQEHPDRFNEALITHIELFLWSMLAAMVLFIPLGIVLSRANTVGPTLVGVIASARVIPSIAVLFLLFPYRRTIGDWLPFFDRSTALVVIALTLLAAPPLIINTDAGMRNVDASILESARGTGMNPMQVFLNVQFPLALPVIVAGVRTAAIEVVASATLAAFVGAGSLGRFITSGLTLLDYRLLLVGAVPVILLALTAEALLAGLERWLTPPVNHS